MGALHKAHAELIRVAREHAGRDGEVAVSVFVNPLQFEPGGDYERYPRPEQAGEERKQATVLFKALHAAADAGKKSAQEIVALARNVINQAPLAQVDYIEVVDTESLEPIEVVRPSSLLAIAVFFGKTRLIDNISLA